MKIEVGKTYKTRTCGIVKIEYDTNANGYPYSHRPFLGNIVKRIDHKSSLSQNHIRVAFFTETGLYNPERGESEFDIVEELNK